MDSNGYSSDFVQLAIEAGALSFGDYTLKCGRNSPYFFNSGVFSSGASIASLGECYARAILASDIEFGCLFGPAYKGIPLVVATAAALARQGCDRPYAFNRREAKTHGEKGRLIGFLKGKVLILDDVITAGTAIREAMEIIKAEGASPAGVVIAMDRQERGTGQLSAVEEVEREFGIPVCKVASLASLIEYMRSDQVRHEHLGKMEAHLEACITLSPDFGETSR